MPSRLTPSHRRDLEPPGERETITVFAVEDNERYVSLLKRMFQTSDMGGFSFEHTSRLADAEPRLLQGGVDTLLLDLQLPDGSGLEWLRANSGRLHVPVIILTAEEGDGIAVEALAAGAQDFIVKSRLNAKDLLRAIRYAMERKRSEEILRQQEEQLRQAQKMEAVGRLAGGIAHDFSNLLTVIIGASERMLEALPAGSPLRAEAETIHHNCGRAATLTRQLLAFSRKQILEPRALDLKKHVSSTTRLLSQFLGEHILLRFEAPEEVWAARADPAQLEQVIVNLAINARDAMPSGGSLTLRLRNNAADDDFVREHPPMTPGEYVVLEVIDTGQGMDAETALHAFEPFFTTKDPGKGSGLGLASVYAIVKQSGGYVWIDSRPGGGTTIGVYLPRTLEVPQPEPAPVASPPTRSFSGTETVLLTEDEAEVRDLVQDILHAHGYKVVATTGPADALACAADWTGDIHLLLSDIVMPGGSGHDLARRLMASRPGLKVLLMSGYPEDGGLTAVQLEPGMGFLAKPFTRAMLLRKVREVLDGQGEADVSAS